MEDLIPDIDRREEAMRRLYQGDDLVGERGIFSEYSLFQGNTYPTKFQHKSSKQIDYQSF